MDDEIAKGQSGVMHLKPRDLYDMGEEIDDKSCDYELFVEQG